MYLLEATTLSKSCSRRIGENLGSFKNLGTESCGQGQQTQSPRRKVRRTLAMSLKTEF